MSAPIVDEAVRLADLMRVEDPDVAVAVRATADIRQARPPCLLVEPSPARTFDPTLCDSGGTAYTLTWRVVALAPPPGDLQAARTLERLIDHAGRFLDAEGYALGTTTAAAYATGIGPDAPVYPAQILTTEGPQTWQS